MSGCLSFPPLGVLCFLLWASIFAIKVDPDARPQAAALLRHKWISATKPSLQRSSLEASQARLRDFNAKRKLKGAVNAVKATNAMKSAIAGMQKGSGSFSRK